jgi:hypothetical protein
MMANNEHGYFISTYSDDNNSPVHEVDLQHWENGEETEDNMFVGNFEHICIYTIPKWYFEENNLKQKIRLVGVNRSIDLPFPNNWSELASRYPLGKVIKIKDDYFEVVAVMLEIVTEAFKNGSWTDTDLFTATIEIKPYGEAEDDSFSIIIEPDLIILKKWTTSK